MRPKSEVRTAAEEAALIRRQALDHLARREHSRAELRAKLLRKGHAEDEVTQVLAQLQAEGLLSDARFAEAYVTARRNRGEGPLRIRAELRRRGVAEELIAAQLEGRDEVWAAVLRAAWRKRFGGKPPRDSQERARQARFLLQRGFTTAQVMELLGADGEVELRADVPGPGGWDIDIDTDGS